MTEKPTNPSDISRRSTLKTAAAAGAGLVVGGSLSAVSGDETPIGEIETIEARDRWFATRAYSLSGNKVLVARDAAAFPTNTLATQIYRPKSAQEIAHLVKTSDATTPVACVCGGHESANAPILASKEAIVLDLAHLKTIEFHRDQEGLLVTVGAGVVFRELVEAIKNQRGALPVGTGPDVGVVGYVVNGGLSGYFSRRLGLLGQRVVKATMVNADGEIRVLTAEDELLHAMMGAGSALGIICDVTVRVEPETAIRSAEQRVFAFENRGQAISFSRDAMDIMTKDVLPRDSLSLELVVTGTKALVATVIFYDNFQGSDSEVLKPLEELADRLSLPMVANAHWSSWYEAAAALWPVINEMKGSPLVSLQHCVGTKGKPSRQILDFICDTVVANAPLDEAEMSIVEIRTLGGAALSKEKIPSGNCQHQFFVDLITQYDAKNKTLDERLAIAKAVEAIIKKAATVEGLSIDFSGTHSQPDDSYASVKPSLIFGSPEMAQSILDCKKKLDPNNRFRFHPFKKLL